jgi:hypothetical protein
LAITIIGDYYSELTEQEASNPTEYEEFLKFYAEFQQISDRLFLALLDPQFRNINSKTFYFKELLLEQGKFPSERNYDFQVLSSK